MIPSSSSFRLVADFAVALRVAVPPRTWKRLPCPALPAASPGSQPRSRGLQLVPINRCSTFHKSPMRNTVSPTLTSTSRTARRTVASLSRPSVSIMIGYSFGRFDRNCIHGQRGLQWSGARTGASSSLANPCSTSATTGVHEAMLRACVSGFSDTYDSRISSPRLCPSVSLGHAKIGRRGAKKR